MKVTEEETYTRKRVIERPYLIPIVIAAFILGSKATCWFKKQFEKKPEKQKTEQVYEIPDYQGLENFINEDRKRVDKLKTEALCRGEYDWIDDYVNELEKDLQLYAKIGEGYTLCRFINDKYSGIGNKTLEDSLRQDLKKSRTKTLRSIVRSYDRFFDNMYASGKDYCKKAYKERQERRRNIKR